MNFPVTTRCAPFGLRPTRFLFGQVVPPEAPHKNFGTPWRNGVRGVSRRKVNEISGIVQDRKNKCVDSRGFLNEFKVRGEPKAASAGENSQPKAAKAAKAARRVKRGDGQAEPAP